MSNLNVLITERMGSFPRGACPLTALGDPEALAKGAIRQLDALKLTVQPCEANKRPPREVKLEDPSIIIALPLYHCSKPLELLRALSIPVYIDANNDVLRQDPDSSWKRISDHCIAQV
eukprot:5187651-Amphidinium_carterae.1